MSMPYVAPSPQPTKPQSLILAEQEAREELRAYFKAGKGRQLDIAAKTGLYPSQLSRMSRLANHPISLEAAILIEVATAGALSARKLCPSKANWIDQFLALYMGQMRKHMELVQLPTDERKSA
jgi:DNA-binding transcriptional regulator YdaS (Cro superfamily)